MSGIRAKRRMDLVMAMVMVTVMVMIFVKIEKWFSSSFSASS